MVMNSSHAGRELQGITLRERLLLSNSRQVSNGRSAVRANWDLHKPITTYDNTVQFLTFEEMSLE